MLFLRIDNFTTSEATITWPDPHHLKQGQWNQIPMRILVIKFPLRFWGKLRPKKNKKFESLSIRLNLDEMLDMGAGEFWKVEKDLGEVKVHVVLGTDWTMNSGTRVRFK
jgi:hypothetical protein